MTVTPATGSGDRQGSRGWMWPSLVLSLALNLLLAGLIGGSLYSARKWSGWGDAGPGNLLAFTTTLAPERRQEIWTTIVPERRALRPFRQEAQQARNEMFRILAAEPFDKAAYIAAHRRVLDVESKARQTAEGMFAKIAEMLTPEERRDYLTWRAKRHAKHGTGFGRQMDLESRQPDTGQRK